MKLFLERRWFELVLVVAASGLILIGVVIGSAVMNRTQLAEKAWYEVKDDPHELRLVCTNDTIGSRAVLRVFESQTSEWVCTIYGWLRLTQDSK